MFQAVADSLITVCLWSALASAGLPRTALRAAPHLVLAVAAGVMLVRLAPL